MAENKFGITEAILIAGIPVTGYWCAFLYELGYNKYFLIPHFFIEIGLLSTLVAIMGVIGVLVSILFIANLFYMAGFYKLPVSIKAPFLKIGFIILLLYGYTIVNRYTFSKFCRYYLPIIAFFLFLEFIFPLLTQRKTKGYLAKLDSQHKFDMLDRTIFDVAAEKLGINIFLLIYTLFLVSLLAYFSGGYKAKTQKDFMIITNKKEFVVLKKYNSQFIVSVLDRSSKSFSNEYKLLPADKELSLFKLERVGPLTCISNENL